MTDQAPKFFTPSELSRRYDGKISTRTLANWRNRKEGPKYTKLGGKVLYRLSDVEAWEQKRTVNGTCEYRK